MGNIPRVGVMQGRLSPPIGGRIQAFPWETWEQEFSIAAELGLSSIEWIVESPVERNPIWTVDGVARIRRVIDATGVAVEFVLIDYLMESPLVRADRVAHAGNTRLMLHVIEQAAKLGARGVEIPCVDHSAISTSVEEERLAEALAPALERAERRGVTLGLETSLSPERFAGLLRRINHPALRANYDIGNSAALGYKPPEEFAAYGSWINNVHIKDRRRGGGTVSLGEGDADLPAVLRLLASLSYTGSYIFQAAREGDERETLRACIRKFEAWHVLDEAPVAPSAQGR